MKAGGPGDFMPRRRGSKVAKKVVRTGGNTPASRVPTRTTGGVMPPTPVRRMNTGGNTPPVRTSRSGGMAAMILNKLGSKLPRKGR